jgi:prepilin signal peptidase PulO-like enzyme (type II secretory pathway)
MIAVLPALTLAALTALALHRRHAWAARDIRFGMPHWVLAILQAAIALPVGTYVGSQYGTTPAIAATAFAWLAVLATVSDIASMRIPREACNSVSVIGLVTFCFTISLPTVWALAASAIAAIGGPAVLRILTRSGLGFSDIRLATAAVCTLSWWVGETTLLYAFIFAALAQQVFRVATLPWRHRIGEWEAVPARRPAPAAADPDAESTTATQGEATELRQRRALPFGPALSLAFLGAALYSTITGVNVFTSWMTV